MFAFREAAELKKLREENAALRKRLAEQGRRRQWENLLDYDGKPQNGMEDAENE